MSASFFGAARRRVGANDQSSSDKPSGTAIAARAFAMLAAIFARLRTMLASDIRRSASASSNCATASIENPAKAVRNASLLRRIVMNDNPD